MWSPGKRVGFGNRPSVSYHFLGNVLQYRLLIEDRATTGTGYVGLAELEFTQLLSPLRNVWKSD